LSINVSNPFKNSFLFPADEQIGTQTFISWSWFGIALLALVLLVAVAVLVKCLVFGSDSRETDGMEASIDTDVEIDEESELDIMKSFEESEYPMNTNSPWDSDARIIIPDLEELPSYNKDFFYSSNF
jgi:hypothetical protein